MLGVVILKTTIYYFTGTGNSLKIAKDLSQKSEYTELVQISKDIIPKNNTANGKVGLVFPIYFWGMPSIVKTFIEKLHIEENSYIFAIANCGGIVGAGFSQLEKTLKIKGLELSASYKIKMPDNYQMIYQVPSKENQNELFKIQEKQIIEIAENVKSNKVLKSKYAGDFIISNIGNVMSGSFNPQNKDKNFWINEKCNGCGTCIKVCPVNNINMSNNKPQWQHDCEQCLACMQWCPQKAIQYKKSTIKKGRYTNPYVNLSEIIKK